MPTPDDAFPDGTGGEQPPHADKTYQFGRYRITVRLGPRAEFLGIVALEVARDFRSFRQMVESTRSHDVSDLYEDK